MKVYIIGSVTSNMYSIKEAAEAFEKMGCEVRHVEEMENERFASIVHDCFLHIDSWADLIVAVPKTTSPTISFGEGVTYEMEHAKAVGKPVVIYYS